MPLQLTLDYALQVVSEPGYHQHVDSRAWEQSLDPTATEANQSFWSDEATRTLMLQPLQLRQGWLNTAAQLDSIIGLTDRGSGKLVANPSNISSKAVFEANIKQNANNPWVHARPIDASGSLVEVLAQIALLALSLKTSFPFSNADARVIAYTEERIAGNQAIYFRWFQGDSQAGFVAIMGISIGQFCLVFANDSLDIAEDISPAKDRTAWRRIMSVPLFAAGSAGSGSNAGAGGRATVAETGVQERAILWLPFRRDLVYIQASSGKWCILKTHAGPQGNNQAGTAADWDIVDDRNVLVWGLSPSVLRFQLQKVKWAGPAARTVHLPPFVLDYTPAAALTAANFFVDQDAFRGTALTFSTPATPAGYDNIVNYLNDCPPETFATAAQTRTYGATFSFTSSSDQRYSPFLYGVDIRIPAAVTTWGVTPTVIGDTRASVARLVDARIAASLEDAADDQCEIGIEDMPPYQLQSLWFRTNYPVRLSETVGPVNLFTGICREMEVQPLHFKTDRPRDLKLNARSLWSLLDDAPLRDQRDWTGTGHIDVVDFVVRQAGVDTTGADYPTPVSAWNAKLGGLPLVLPQEDALQPHWQPKETDTAAKFIERIAEEFAGFRAGFYPTGQFYYLPTDPYFYNTSEATVFKERGLHRAGPCYEEPINSMEIEPEANVVQVIGQSRTGALLRSSLWVDWASIKNSAAVNFLGRWRPAVYQKGGVLTCAEINRIARTIWQQTRRRHLRIRFTGDYLPTLRLGRALTLEGQPGTYRLIKYQAEFPKEGVQQARYEVELIEKGYQ